MQFRALVFMQVRAQFHDGRLVHGLPHLKLRVHQVDQGQGCSRATCLVQGAQRLGRILQVAAFAVELGLQDFGGGARRTGRAPDGIANHLRR